VVRAPRWARTERDRRDFRCAFPVPRVNWWSYGPAPDGQRFLVSVAGEEGETTINLITNWRQALSVRKAP
jgi:hypothetical protein